jgi:demethylmenaquinone methyltransferase/2-methoxy-6-polyprenyl-1,4-benzoquinol methylase
LERGLTLSNLPAKEKKETYVKELFNTISKGYDRTNKIMSLGNDERWRKAVVERAKIRPGDSILDVCCGTAKLTMQLAEATGSSGQVTGLDFSENMISVGKQNIAKHPLQANITLLQGNAMSLPFPAEQFDAVTVAWGLRNVPDISQTLAEVLRVLKPEGKFVSLDMSKPQAPVFRQAYWLYFEKLVPWIGRLSAGKESAYRYFYESAKEFPEAPKLEKLLAECGFNETTYRDVMGGTLAIVEGRKPKSNYT